MNGQTYKKPRFTGGFDMPLLVVVVSLVVFGLSMLYSSSWDFSLGAYGDAMYMFNRQLTWLGLGLFAALVLAFFDYHNWRRFVVPAMALTIGLLIVVLLMNEIRFGAKRAILGNSSIARASRLARKSTSISVERLENASERARPGSIVF